MRDWIRMTAVAALAAAAGCAVLRAQAPADTPANPMAGQVAAAKAGAEAFSGTCAVCHGAGAIGGRGPALNTGHLAHGETDYDLYKVIHDGISGAGMPSFATLDANEIWRLVTYIRSLDPAAAVTGGQAPTRGNATAGANLFVGKGGCAACHEINGRGSATGPDLSAIGARGLAAIRSGMMHDPATRSRFAPRWVIVTLAKGKGERGVIRGEDSFVLLLGHDDGTTVRLDRRNVKAIVDDPAATAAMRTVDRLGADEREDVVAFLAGQRARAVSATIEPKSETVLAPARLVGAKAEPQNWPSYWGGYESQHFTALRQIAPSNVRGLQAQWAAQLPGPSALQAAPIVVDGVMYVAGSPGSVYALDATTGLKLWTFTRKQDVINSHQINPSNRGVALLGGRVFVSTLDNLLIALDARTGRELWERRVADTMDGFEMTGAPLALPDKIVVGVGGGEFGLRGFLDAYDPATGKRIWRFATIPGPGEPGSETWAGDAWKIGGGGTWLTGSYDAQTNTLYWAVGNPAPSFNPAVRPGDNLYTCSVIALDAATGKIKWHYQFTPNDGHDWDSAEAMVLADGTIDGRPRKLLLHADRNGLYYVLDRTSGEFLLAKPFVTQTWLDGFDARGRPIVRPDAIVTPKGVTVFPAVGGTNFQAPSYDPANRRFFVVFQDSAGNIAQDTAVFKRGEIYTAGRRIPPITTQPPVSGIKALDAFTGRELWRFAMPRVNLQAGVLGTSSGLLFASAADGNMFALDARTGAPLWHYQTGGPISASPIAYAVDGRQHVAIAAGNTVYSFALPDARR